MLNSDFNASLSSKSLPKQSDSEQNKEIHIPKIEEMFKEQEKEYVLYESRMMRNQLSKAIDLIDSGVSKIKSYSNSNLPELDTRRSSVNDKLPSLNINHNSSTLNEEDYEIDKMIEKNFNNSRRLRDKMNKEKKDITSSTDKLTPDSKNMSFYINIPQRPKKKVLLSGVKSITFSEGDRKIQITPASSLLISINRMSHGKEKKEEELEGLIKNSYQNRESALFEKSLFYEQENPFNNLNPSSQFKLRQIMNKNLQHRLELSKNQVNKFVAYLAQIKEYHVILNETILSILKEIREMLLSGKVMKVSDLTAIVNKKESKELSIHPNNTIIKNLTEMMI